MHKETFTSHNLDSFITTFHKKVREGPYYICSVCNRILYRKTVQEALSSTFLQEKSPLTIKNISVKHTSLSC